MAKRTVEVIDGFSQVQAFKRATAKGAIASQTKPKQVTPTPTVNSATVASVTVASPSGRVGVAMPSLRPMSSSTVSASAPTSGSVPLNQIGVTVVPKKRVVTCYNCGYSYTLAGKIHVPYCPKCKLLLCVDDIIIDGEQSADIKTIGDVIIKQTARLADGITINGRSVTIGGDVSRCAAVLASEQIKLDTGAIFSSTVLEKTSVVIAAGSEVQVPNVLKCVTLTVEGKLTGTVEVADCITIKVGGYIVGDISAQRLIMELGAGITGACRIIKQ
jgi:cytoskeletal protein CcmA (bactofilin family)